MTKKKKTPLYITMVFFLGGGEGGDFNIMGKIKTLIFVFATR